jgi:dUTP pyrophosphatase
MSLKKLKQSFKDRLVDLVKEPVAAFLQSKFVPKQITIKVKKLEPTASLPTKAYQNDAGLDLYALERSYVRAGEWRPVRTGLAFEIPDGWHFQVHTRSSYSKHRIRCHLGIIDSGYRNELIIIVFNDGYEDFIIEPGSKFSQIVVLPVPELSLEEVSELSESDRGQGGFGSSGK